MRLYKQKEIDDLIGCPKVIIEAPKREMKPDKGQLRNDMRLKSVVGDVQFRVFMRCSEMFNEDFSIGLAFTPHDGSGELILLRCNGKHGGFNNNFDASHPHWEYHIHKASEKAIQEELRPERYAAKTDEYACYIDALGYFLKEANVVDASNHFPEIAQRTLFPPEDV